jgi:hypothetical protein
MPRRMQGKSFSGDRVPGNDEGFFTRRLPWLHRQTHEDIRVAASEFPVVMEVEMP